MNKILSLKTLSKLSSKLRKQGIKLIFTPGCFDILHIGHVEFFKLSKKLGGSKSVLVVGVESDEYVHSTKGDGHPFLTQNVRAKMLASLEVVNYVLPINMDRRENSDFVAFFKQISAEWITLGHTDKKIVKRAKQEAVEAGSKFKQVLHSRKLDSSSRIIDKLSKI